jgi:hypothetical protein
MVASFFLATVARMAIRARAAVLAAAIALPVGALGTTYAMAKKEELPPRPADVVRIGESHPDDRLPITRKTSPRPSSVPSRARPRVSPASGANHSSSRPAPTETVRVVPPPPPVDDGATDDGNDDDGNDDDGNDDDDDDDGGDGGDDGGDDDGDDGDDDGGDE